MNKYKPPSKDSISITYTALIFPDKYIAIFNKGYYLGFASYTIVAHGIHDVNSYVRKRIITDFNSIFLGNIKVNVKMIKSLGVRVSLIDRRM